MMRHRKCQGDDAGEGESESSRNNAVKSLENFSEGL